MDKEVDKMRKKNEMEKAANPTKNDNKKIN